MTVGITLYEDMLTLCSRNLTQISESVPEVTITDHWHSPDYKSGALRLVYFPSLIPVVQLHHKSRPPYILSFYMLNPRIGLFSLLLVFHCYLFYPILSTFHLFL